jgi:hypothetical protein
MGPPYLLYRGAATVLICLTVEDVDAVCERARAAGAEISEEPVTSPTGSGASPRAIPKDTSGTSHSRSATWRPRTGARRARRAEAVATRFVATARRARRSA